MSDPGIFPEAEKALSALNGFRGYARSLKEVSRKRTHLVRGRRKSVEKMVSVPFKRASSRILYGIAIEIERILERHYQIKSGETYVILSKAASQLYLSVAGKIEAASRAAAMKTKKEKQ